MSLTDLGYLIAFVSPFVILGFVSWFKFNQLMMISSDTVEIDRSEDDIGGPVDSDPEDLIEKDLN